MADLVPQLQKNDNKTSSHQSPRIDQERELAEILTNKSKWNGDGHAYHTVPEAAVVVWCAMVRQILQALEQSFWLEQRGWVQKWHMIELRNASIRRFWAICIFALSADKMWTHGRIDSFERPFLIFDAIHQTLSQHIRPSLPVKRTRLIRSS